MERVVSNGAITRNAAIDVFKRPPPAKERYILVCHFFDSRVLTPRMPPSPPPDKDLAYAEANRVIVCLELSKFHKPFLVLIDTEIVEESAA